MIPIGELSEYAKSGSPAAVKGIESLAPRVTKKAAPQNSIPHQTYF